MKKFIRRGQAGQGELDLPVSVLSGELGLPRAAAAALVSRGITTAAEAERFLRPSAAELSDPFLLSGMREAADRTLSALENGERILVYGDYDADGICASAILTRALTAAGGEVDCLLPRRDDGYGLSMEMVERIAEDFSPDLIITCDCGISCAKEIEYIIDLGMDVIVTDHHELPAELPPCVTVNPKIGDRTDSRELCGAGVAFKFVWATLGREAAMEYIDLAAVATVGDMVPLMGENRVICAEGINAMNRKMRPALKSLVFAAGGKPPVSATDIAFKIVPRLNSAGRMGDPMRAFALLMAEEPARIEELTALLEADNAGRRSASDVLLSEALGDLRAEPELLGRAVILSGAAWEKGVAGIAAAQLCSYFARPVLLMCKAQDGTYKGTARSVEGINIHSVLASAAELLDDFGGHNQAAGFSIAERNIPAFRERVLAFLEEGDFAAEPPAEYYDAEIAPEEINLDLARCLEALEPCGTGNPAPQFLLKAGAAKAEPLKNKPAHLSVSFGGLSAVAFNSAKQEDVYNSPTEKSMLAEVSVSYYGGRESASTVIRSMDAGSFAVDTAPDKVLCQYLHQAAMDVPEIRPGNRNALRRNRIRNYGAGEAARLYRDLTAENCCGTLVLASRHGSYSEFLSAGGRMLRNDFIYSGTMNNCDGIILAPEFDFEAAFYKNIIFLDAPLLNRPVEMLLNSCNADIWLPEDASGAEELKAALAARISHERAEFVRYYRILAAYAGAAAATPYALWAAAEKRESGIELPQFFAAYHVFRELGFLGIRNGVLEVVKGAKAELSESSLYTLISELRKG